MTLHEQRIVRFLSHPSHYPHAVRGIVRRETHVSHVFLAGDYAYKVKKPVKFPFLDASALSRRKRFCQLELSLNRRLAPATYLGLVPIVETPRGLRLSGRGNVVEWVVRMRRLPEDRMLDQLIRRRAVSPRDMARVVKQLMPFFRRAARSRTISRYGQPAQVAALVLGNLQECEPFVGTLLPQADRRFLEICFRQFLTLHEPILSQRVQERRVIDGHGDLRCENICLPRRQAGPARASDSVVIFDCVEFQPAFRCGDLANDLSFLLMDLEFRGRQDLADALVSAYRKRIKDPTLDAVLPFYKCHRTLVRGKVRGLAWLQHPHSAEGRWVRRLSRQHFKLALRYARQLAPPRLVVVGGLIGTGKSTLAKALARALGATWLRTDDIRLREFARFRRPTQGVGGGLYAPHVSDLVYQRLIRRAEALVREGRSVICDGMFSRRIGRETLRAVAHRHGASFHFFECTVPRAVALRRIARRYTRRTDLSEARPEHYDRLSTGYEPVGGWPASAWTRLSDNRPPAATYQAALKTLRRVWGS